jgi:PAS domain S-box-containing protein
MKETQKSTGVNQSSGHFEKMLGEIDDYAIIFLNKEGIITKWNRGAEKIKGYPAAEAIGKNFEMFYPEEDKRSGLPRRLLQQAAETGKAIYEGWRVRKDATFFWGSVLITALHDEKGEVMGFAKVTRDLTERKHAEDVLRKKNRELERINQELSSFAYIASHDLQEPLRKIQTFISRISELEKDNLSERSRDYFTRIENAGERMQQLINDLLSYSRTRPDETKMEDVDLNALLRDVIKNLSQAIEEKHATVDVGDLPHVRGIKFQLQQLFANLLSNALKFSRAGVRPHIRVAALKENLTEEEVREGNQIIVEDNGIGFDEEYKEKIFELFQRLHGRSEYAGTGIGLAIVKKIVENHNGSIYATSVPGQGSTFHISLPS